MNLIDMHCDTIWKLMETNGTTLNDNPFCIDLRKIETSREYCPVFCLFHLSKANLREMVVIRKRLMTYAMLNAMLARIKQEIVQK